MTSPVTNPGKGFARMALALALAAIGMSVASAEPPGAAVIGFVLMLAAVIFGVRTAGSRLPAWAGRTAIAVGALLAASAAFLIHSSAIEAPLFAQAPGVPSISAPAPSSHVVAAVDRARPMVRAALMEQNLPGVSIAVGIGGGSGEVVWAEGFGWRDVVTETPVTPDTRFNIGTAAQVVTPGAAASLRLTQTGTDPAGEWSPTHVGEPEEDFPGFTAVHDLILRPLGLSAPRQPLPGDRATFYVPATFWKGVSTDPRSGRRLMPMRDLACCAGNRAFYSTPSDLVRFALATNADSVTGELAGGSVMSLLTRRDNGIVVAVASNIAHANTADLAQGVADTFAEQMDR
jgi:CubicO group peptidase (beta-lactamase class C family)